MLERIGTAGQLTVSEPDRDVCAAITELLGRRQRVVFAEIGVGIGATTLPAAEALKGRGEVHIFDFEEKVSELRDDLAARGLSNVVAHGNSTRQWDSYNWSLAKLLNDAPREGMFDLVYIDGSHAYLHDALAFFQCDRLLRQGGYMILDDAKWTFSGSRIPPEVIDAKMTAEQAARPQIQMVIDHFVSGRGDYHAVRKSRVFLKETRPAGRARAYLARRRIRAIQRKMATPT